MFVRACVHVCAVCVYAVSCSAFVLTRLCQRTRVCSCACVCVYAVCVCVCGLYVLACVVASRPINLGPGGSEVRW